MRVPDEAVPSSKPHAGIKSVKAKGRLPLWMHVSTDERKHGGVSQSVALKATLTSGHEAERRRRHLNASSDQAAY